MYEFDSRVRYSEVDHHGTMTVPALINYFQDCSTFQSEDLGIGTTVLKEEKRAWLLSYWQVILSRKPELGEDHNRNICNRIQGIVWKQKLLYERCRWKISRLCEFSLGIY